MPNEPHEHSPKPRCQRCNGCGKIADTSTGEPWTSWLELPLRSSMAVLAGAVKPINCPDCGGTGYDNAS